MTAILGIHNHRLITVSAVRLPEQLPLRDVTGNPFKRRTAMNIEFLFEPSSKRRKGFPSETRVKSGFPSGSF